ncbi:AraC family transcriptional regulator [Rhizobacter sp. LjRoot28]
MDHLAPLLDHFKVRARLFHAGPLCGSPHYGAGAGVGFLHVLRAGTLEIVHPAGEHGLPARLHLTEPTLLLYARPVPHQFICSATAPADLVCASIAFEGGAQHPLVQGLPPLLSVPLQAFGNAHLSLQLLFDEADAVRAGQQLLADRLVEVVLVQVLRWLLDSDISRRPHHGLLAGLAHPGLARALTAMHEQPAQAWTIAALAREAAMSRSAFALAFKRTVGEPPAAYLSQWRLSIARQRLAAGHPLKQVAGDVGYQSASALSRAFALREGASPREWLRGQAGPA